MLARAVVIAFAHRSSLIRPVVASLAGIEMVKRTELVQYCQETVTQFSTAELEAFLEEEKVVSSSHKRMIHYTRIFAHRNWAVYLLYYRISSNLYSLIEPSIRLAMR